MPGEQFYTDPLNDVVKRSLGAVVAADVHLVGGEVLLDQSTLNSESVPIEAGAGVQTYADIEGIAKAPLPA